MSPHDERDVQVLRGVRDLYEAADPMPPDLVGNIKFALGVEDLNIEVARPMSADVAVSGARSEEESRLVTFDSDSLTIVVQIGSDDRGAARIDGWLVPEAPHVVELRAHDVTWTANADQHGRFAFTSVPRGAVQLVVRVGPVHVTTPAIVL